MHLHYLQNDSDKGGRESKTNSKSHAVSQTAYRPILEQMQSWETAYGVKGLININENFCKPGTKIKKYCPDKSSIQKKTTNIYNAQIQYISILTKQTEKYTMTLNASTKMLQTNQLLIFQKCKIEPGAI